jgi:predicted DNA-binding ribbon-helix-helix protein
VSQTIKKRSVEIAGHRTSLTLEEAFWRALKRLAAKDRVSINKLIERIDRERQGNLSSAVRVYLLERLEAAAEPETARAASRPATRPSATAVSRPLPDR